jgi:hypothetical protein
MPCASVEQLDTLNNTVVRVLKRQRVVKTFGRQAVRFLLAMGSSGPPKELLSKAQQVRVGPPDCTAICSALMRPQGQCCCLLHATACPGDAAHQGRTSGGCP